MNVGYLLPQPDSAVSTDSSNMVSMDISPAAVNHTVSDTDQNAVAIDGLLPGMGQIFDFRGTEEKSTNESLQQNDNW